VVKEGHVRGFGPIDNAPRDTPLGGNRNCTEQGVPTKRARYSSAVRLAVRYEENLVGSHARPPSTRLLSQQNKVNVHSRANAGVEGSFALLGSDDSVARGARSGRQDGSQQRGYDSHIVCHTSTIVSNWCVDIPRTCQAAGDEVGRLEMGAVATRAESRV
jgi:hypothetical protein